MTCARPGTPERPFAPYRSALCGSTLLMIGLSWPLWVDGFDWPRVPFLAGWPQFPRWVSWATPGGIVGALGMASLGRAWRPMIGLGLLLLAFAILGDQDRLQPWAYQFLVIGPALACLSRARALRVARCYVISLYVYSGLSKLDASFVAELGPTFLAAGLGPFGISPAGWTATARTLAILAMPASEISVGVRLAIPATRRIGLVGSVGLHSTLILILGPWGLGHSAIVLAWNGSLILENLILFGPNVAPSEVEADTVFGPLAWAVFAAALVLPAGERSGLCDAWPAHALYASHCERADVSLHEDELDRFPESIRRRLDPEGIGPWRRLDLTGWSRDVRGTPVYPSARIGLAVGEFLESRYASVRPVRVVRLGRASLLEGRRTRDEAVGLKAIRALAGQFLLNAHPAGIGGRD